MRTDQIKKVIRDLGSHLVIITDESVAALYGRALQKDLQVDLVAFPAGERSKTRDTKAKIEDQLFSLGLGRDGGVIALGGGVVTDVAGFVAATYCRGIPYLSIPTTLLGMVDAAIGGKTGVNLPGGKNMIGAFYPPREILIDPDFLESLGEGELRNGMAEVIKYGAIWDEVLFQELHHVQGWDLKWLSQIVQKSARIKEAIIQQDPLERGLRHILNFGHTIGHAIETLQDYSIPHGEAVAIGMIGEARLTGHEAPLISLIEKFGFHLKLSKNVTPEALFEVMKKDKKAKQQVPRFVQLQHLGKVDSFHGSYCAAVADERLFDTLNWMVSWIRSQ